MTGTDISYIRNAWCIRQFRPKGVIQVIQIFTYLSSFFTNKHHRSITIEYNIHKSPTGDCPTITWSATLPYQSQNDLHNSKMFSKNNYELDVSLCTNISTSSRPTSLLYALLTVYRTVAHRWIKVPAGLCKFLHTNTTVTHKWVTLYHAFPSIHLCPWWQMIRNI